MALINTQIKPFNATAFKAGEFIEVSDKDLSGKWSVFFFYPADFTFVCPTELGDVADHYAEFQSRGVEIYSVSTDTHFTHKAWHDSSETIGKIQYTMIGDPTGEITRNFEVMREGQGLAANSVRRRCSAAARRWPDQTIDAGSRSAGRPTTGHSADKQQGGTARHAVPGERSVRTRGQQRPRLAVPA